MKAPNENISDNGLWELVKRSTKELNININKNTRDFPEKTKRKIIENKKDEPQYKEVSKFVGGMVECVSFPNGDLLLLNEEGKLMQLPLNPEATALWRATLDTIDFMPLVSANYSGGIIITDWYGEENENDAIKITIQFLSNEVRSDALNIKVFKKKCTNLTNCKVIQSQSNISQELRVAILKRAALYKSNDIEKNRIEYPIIKDIN